jgi:hypothetical protein
MRRFLLLGAAVLTFSLAAAPTAFGALSTSDLNTVTANDLANTLVGPGVSVSNVTYTGANVAGGTFAGGTGIIGFEEGVVLSSGNVASVVGPNTVDNATTQNGTAGDADLNALVAPRVTNDAAVLEFDFVPDADKVFFEYVFSSEEYNEWVNSNFDDVFGFFVNGTNCAVVGTDRVSINTINNGNPFGAGTITNPHLYINNDLSDGGGAIDTQMDGLTVVLTCEAAVTPNATNHMKLAIADTTDLILDSNVFIKEGSLSTTPPGENTCGEVYGQGTLKNSSTVRFDLRARFKTGSEIPEGHVTWNDTGLAFTSSNVTSFIIDGNTATFQGTGLANGVAVSYTIQVVDGRDAITITLSNGYTATGELRNGRIVIRHNCD